ncbi:MaoC family dehydratase [Solimonas sp. K1W22B-7]|uniref:MaoC family dehydratase N-terminal domain-containing protein n=1 Tax=Solimonas sp. K1W22B-7 TaxID=2303331 RepID=UPI000E32F8BB|nr:MaoC family dehydratase N-terminal domain-containing protein [Solimonas sp. K1W22B-7]AXQ29387.1 MaoC family dehydratase [Solimonas sp. K1W22B-7]
MIDRNLIGHELSASSMDIERGRLKFFAKATGETSPLYLDEAAARAAGHPDLPAPPSFLFGAELDSGGLEELLALLKVDLGTVLHGEQEFSYHRMAYAGDRISVSSKITDIYDKKNGALQFVVKQSQASNQNGEPVAEMRCTLVVRSQGKPS